MIGVFVSSVVDLGFKPLSDQTKDWKKKKNGGLMIGVLVSSVVDLGFKPLSDQTKDWNFCKNSSPPSLMEKEQKLVGSELNFTFR